MSARRALTSESAQATAAAAAARREHDRLLDRAAATRFVLAGEASHGTYDFYRDRAELTKRLIAEQGYTIVAAEADWPDAYRVNRFVRGVGDDPTPERALEDFRRFPSWMWRNVVVDEFAGWLRDYNDALPAGQPKVGFYGLDLYSLHRSMEEVVRYLDRVDPEAARRARDRYSCFDHYGTDPQLYGLETTLGGADPCEQAAVEVLLELQHRIAREATRADGIPDDEHFYAERNAQLVVNAEEYYRAAFYGRSESWNLRDQHMAQTLEALVAHLQRGRPQPPRAVVWAHNSHLGDARATRKGRLGELNLGQLVRERHGDDALLLGYTTYTGTVTAASRWGGLAERKHVRPALPGSWEQLLHDRNELRLLVDPASLQGTRLQRAIGVIYLPQTERVSHYFEARIADQFDAVLHIEDTLALEPLERTSLWEEGELPETYPWGV